MVNINKFFGSCIRGIGAIGSLFVRRTADGRYEIAVAPLPVLFLATSLVTCTLQRTEPFHQCIRSNLAVFQEVINAV